MHRNLLLPFSAIPKISQVEDTFPQKPVCKPTTRQEKAKPEPITNLYISEHSSESEEEVFVTFPSHKNPKRRISNTPDVSRVSKTRDSSSSYVSQGHSNITINSTPGPVSNTSGDQSSTNVQGSDLSSTILYSTAEASGASVSPAAPPPQRRSGQNRQAPKRYGEWVCQQTAENSDLIGYFV